MGAQVLTRTGEKADSEGIVRNILGVDAEAPSATRALSVISNTVTHDDKLLRFMSTKKARARTTTAP